MASKKGTLILVIFLFLFIMCSIGGYYFLTKTELGKGLFFADSSSSTNNNSPSTSSFSGSSTATFPLKDNKEEKEGKVHADQKLNAECSTMSPKKSNQANEQVNQEQLADKKEIAKPDDQPVSSGTSSQPSSPDPIIAAENNTESKSGSMRNDDKTANIDASAGRIASDAPKDQSNNPLAPKTITMIDQKPEKKTNLVLNATSHDPAKGSLKITMRIIEPTKSDNNVITK